jgi:hypothetical protein
MVFTRVRLWISCELVVNIAYTLTVWYFKADFNIILLSMPFGK